MWWWKQYTAREQPTQTLYRTANRMLSNSQLECCLEQPINCSQTANKEKMYSGRAPLTQPKAFTHRSAGCMMKNSQMLSARKNPFSTDTYTKPKPTVARLVNCHTRSKHWTSVLEAPCRVGAFFEAVGTASMSSVFRYSVLLRYIETAIGKSQKVGNRS